MVIEDLLAKRGMTKYKLAVQAGIPHPTLSDICSGKTKLEKCSAETVYKLSQVVCVFVGNASFIDFCHVDAYEVDA